MTSLIVMMSNGYATRTILESESMTKRNVNMEPIHREAFPPKARTY
ncbi:hypothetical protein OK016_04115 [Vibrio chagasii]|nr:hypothetical protein [Vibrio chagasii]